LTPSSPPLRLISGREWRFVWVTIAVVLLLTSLPYAYGYLSSPPDKQFMGLMQDIPDHAQYLSWWREFQHALVVSNKLTPEANSPLFFNLLWWLLAQISRFTGLDYPIVYQAFRWVAGGSLLWALYRLLALLLPDIPRRRTAFLLTTFSAGLGWVWVALKYSLANGNLLFPQDVYIAEGNTFLCILGFPHFAFAATFIVLSFEFIWRGWTYKRTKSFVIAGILALLLSWMHAYDLIILYGITGVFGVLVWIRDRAFPWRLFWGGVIVVALSCSGAVYAVILTRTDPLWKEILAQFTNAGIFTPSPFHMGMLFGLPLLLAILAWIGLAWRKQWQDTHLFVMAWFVGNLVINYIPTVYQIHMLNGWQIPIMILAAMALHDFLIPAVSRRRPAMSAQASRWIVAACLLAVLPTNLYLWSWRFIELSRHTYSYYLARDEIAGLEWLKQNAPPADIVLASETIGQYVPAISGNTAFLAHWAQTVNYYDKVAQVINFFDLAGSDAGRAQTVGTYHVAYIFWGPAERLLGAYDPAAVAWLFPAYANPQVTIFQVAIDNLPAPTP
jgi:hypothetical protein